MSNTCRTRSSGSSARAPASPAVQAGQRRAHRLRRFPRHRPARRARRRWRARCGVEIPVESRKRCVFVFEARRVCDECPLVIDTSGVYFRPEGRHYVDRRLAAGAGSRQRRFRGDLGAIRGDAVAGARRANPRVRGAEAGPRLGRPLRPQHLRSQRDRRPAAGLSTTPISRRVFPATACSNRRRSGAGSAELIAHGRYLTLDLSDFAYERIAAGRPLLERNVI